MQLYRREDPEMSGFVDETAAEDIATPLSVVKGQNDRPGDIGHQITLGGGTITPHARKRNEKV
jgi:hypothetical protein